MDFEAGRRTAGGYLAVPESGTGPGVLVLHAWWGLNGFFTGLCDRLAAAGMVALAPDLYGAGQVATTVEEAQRLGAAADGDAEGTWARVRAARAALGAHPAVSDAGRVGVLGCSMGVWWALQLAARPPGEGSADAAVLFYGVGEAEFGPESGPCAFQGHFGEEDAWDSVEDARTMADALRASGRSFDLHAYPGVGHWFFEADRPDAYDEAAARLAWERTVAFLNATLRR